MYDLFGGGGGVGKGILASDIYKLSYTKFCLVAPIDTIHVLGVHYEVLSGDSVESEEILPLWVGVQVFMQGARRGRQSDLVQGCHHGVYAEMDILRDWWVDLCIMLGWMGGSMGSAQRW